MANIHIDLAEDLGAGQYVEILNPKVLNWKKQKQIAATAKEGDLATQLDATELLALSLIKTGNVLDENDKPITFPLTAETIGDVPAVIIEKVSQAFAEAKKADTPKN